LYGVKNINIFFRFPADEFKCVEEGCLLGNRLHNLHDLISHVKSHKARKPDDQDSGFNTDQSGKKFKDPSTS
jgi:hypothetical protein